jgi:hypothetical protein
MKVWEELLACLHPGLPLPVHLERARGRCLVHVSDTPSNFYGDLGKILDYLQPMCFVHTGDLVDDLKIAIRPGYGKLFRRRLKLLSEAVSPVPPAHIAIVIGNHDIEPDVRAAFPGALVFDEGARMSLCGLDVAVAHSLEELPIPPAAFNLFGHDVDVPPEQEGSLFLNGVIGINVILLDSGSVEVVPYPVYVDDARCCRRKTGL